MPCLSQAELNCTQKILKGRKIVRPSNSDDNVDLSSFKLKISTSLTAALRNVYSFTPIQLQLFYVFSFTGQSKLGAHTKQTDRQMDGRTCQYTAAY